MRVHVLITGILTLAIAATDVARAQPTSQPAQPAKPNVVVLLIDDLGSGDVGWRGGQIPTPNIDKLAADGAKLDAFYVLPVCSPTRAALLTGRYPFRYGLQSSVVRPWASYGLPTDERTLAQAVREVGYETAIVGKWHLGHSKPEYLPMARGFEHQYGHYNGALDYFTHERDGGHDWHRDDQRLDEDGYATTLIADEAIRLIRTRDRQRPLLLYVPFNAVHSPFQVPERYAAPFTGRPNRRTYMGMVASVDEQVGRITAALRDAGMTSNTLVLFASDNGGPNPGVLSSNGDLRGGKGQHYEGGVRVCAAATWPGHIPAGSTVEAPMHIVDWYATILALAGASSEQAKPVDGKNVLPLLTGKQTESVHDEIILNVAPNSGALRVGKWKLVVNGGRATFDDAGDPRPLTRAARYELFDLAADRSEKTNVAAEHPDVLNRLTARYEELKKTAAPAFNDSKPDGFQAPAVWGQFDAESMKPTTRPNRGEGPND